MQETSTKFANCGTIEEKESHDKLVHLAVRFFRYPKTNFKKSFGGFMLYCRLNILKRDENGNWYKPKNQHRIRRFFVEDIFYRFVWTIEWFLFEKYW